MRTQSYPIITLLIVLAVLLSGCDSTEDASTSIFSKSGDSSHPATVAILAHSDFVPDRTAIATQGKIGLPDVLAERIIEHLTNSKRFIPVDRTALRRTVMEQRFGQNLANSYLDRSLDKAIDAMESVDGGSVFGVRGQAIAPKPVGAGIGAASGTVGTTGTLSNLNDILKDFQDLGTTVGADFLILGNLEKVAYSNESIAVPYSESGRQVHKQTADARLNLRIIDANEGTVKGATSLRTQISENFFQGKTSDTDAFTIFDHVGRLAAAKILDVTFPARIVSTEPLVISRGSNDGTLVEDIYLIEREGKAIADDSGQVIARLNNEIGRVKVVSLQETVAIVEPISEGDFSEGDLAKLDTEAASRTTPIPTSATVNLKNNKVGQPRPHLAVILIKQGSTESRTSGLPETHVTYFTDTIISRLTQTKRFEMLDRQEIDQLLTEQTLQALRDDRDLASAVGTLQGADYLVYGSLAAFDIEIRRTQLPGSTRVIEQKLGYIEGNMRIVDARSGKIMESRKISVQDKVDANASNQRSIALLADAYAEQVVLMLMNKLYPIRVASVSSDGTVYINRGNDGGLFSGEILEAYRPGPPVIDPETGVQLGQEEAQLGQIRLTEVEDARSKGTALAGTILAIGDLLKRSQENIGRRSKGQHFDGAPKQSGAVLADHGSPEPQGKLSGERYTLVVGELKLRATADKRSLENKDRIKHLTDDLIFKLAKTNRFKVMERQEIDQVLDEKTFDALVSDGSVDSRLRELIGADYLIHGELDRFYIITRTSEVPYLDELETTAEAVAEGVFRVVDVHTGEVKTGERVRVSYDAGRVENIEQVKADLQDRFSTDAVAQIVGHLFPIKVLGIAGDGIVYLNRGDDAGLKQGELFDVMRPGQMLVDPDTGRSFGSIETKIATLSIVSVETSRSRGTLTSGESVVAGDILRKSQSTPKTAEQPSFTPNW